MSLKLAGHLFTGPFPIDGTEVRANQGPVVYAIIAKGGPAWAPTFRVVDIGHSPEQGIVFVEHPNRARWSAKPGESLAVYLFYARRSEYSATDRERIVGELRRQYDPPNGSSFNDTDVGAELAFIGPDPVHHLHSAAGSVHRATKVCSIAEIIRSLVLPSP